MDRAGATKSLSNRATVIVILILLNIVICIISEKNYQYTGKDDSPKKSKYSNTENLEQIDELLEQGEYMDCVYYMYDNNIIFSGADDYHDIRGLIHINEAYSECFKYMEALVYLPKDEDSANDISGYCSRLSIECDDFYEVYDVWIDSSGTEKYTDSLTDMEYELRTAMKLIFNMDDDEYDDYLTLSESQKAVRLEEKINNGK